MAGMPLWRIVFLDKNGGEFGLVAGNKTTDLNGAVALAGERIEFSLILRASESVASRPLCAAFLFENGSITILAIVAVAAHLGKAVSEIDPLIHFSLVLGAAQVVAGYPVLRK